MDKTLKIYITLFILAVIALLFYEKSKPQPVNWFPSYVKNHKIPYGTYVLYHSLEDLFPKKEVEDVSISPYLFLKAKERIGNYIFVDHALNLDKESLKKLLEFVEKGNTVFISTHGINIDTLNLETKQIYDGPDEEAFFKLYSPSFKNKEYSFDRHFNNFVFSKIDTTKVTVLGQTGFVNQKGERTESGVNFIKYKHGKGYFLFHTFPEAFTNYQILNTPQEKYAAGVLSYIKKEGPILWDAYLKTGKSRITSPLHFILTNKSLKWAYYILLIGVLIFVLFEGKRKQRSIPIIKPLKNQSLAFTRTIANMYYEKQEHKNIAEQQIQYFLAYIRQRFHLDTLKPDDTFYQNLSARSGIPLASIEKLFKHIDFIHRQNNISPEPLEKLNTMIQKFKQE